MYDLWKENKLQRPSEYWNYSIGDKLVIRAFYEELVEEKQKARQEIKNKDINVFPVTII